MVVLHKRYSLLSPSICHSTGQFLFGLMIIDSQTHFSLISLFCLLESVGNLQSSHFTIFHLPNFPFYEAVLTACSCWRHYRRKYGGYSDLYILAELYWQYMILVYLHFYKHPCFHKYVYYGLTCHILSLKQIGFAFMKCLHQWRPKLPLILLRWYVH